VYIPYVVELVAYTDNLNIPAGEAEKVYEDMGYKPNSGGFVEADYEAVPSAASLYVAKSDYPMGVWEDHYSWDARAAAAKKINLAADDNLWFMLPVNTDTGGAMYLMGNDNTGANIVAAVLIKTFYYVDKIVCKGIRGKIGPFYGDQDFHAWKAKGGTVGTSGAAGDGIDWEAELRKADLDLEIWYYPSERRALPMWEFSNALNKVNLMTPTSTGAAALIQIVGGNTDVAAGTAYYDSFGNKMDVSKFVDFLIDEFPVKAYLFYYDDDITAPPGTVYGTPGNTPTNTSWPNAAIVDISGSGAIYRFNELKVEKRAIENGNPEVFRSSITGPAGTLLYTNINQFVYRLNTYYKVYQEWVSPTGSGDPLTREIPIGVAGANIAYGQPVASTSYTGNTMATLGLPPGRYPLKIGGDYKVGIGEWPDFAGVEDFENEDPEGNEIVRDLNAVLYFQLPITEGTPANYKNPTGPGSFEWQDLTFPFDVLP